VKTILIAIDPGASGGVVTVWPDGKLEAVGMPDDADMRDLIEECRLNANVNGYGIVCFMELVGGFIAGMPVPGSAMFNFGDGFGYIRGLLAGYRIETRLIRPQEWQAGIPGVRGQKEKAVRKRALKEHAARLFPALKVTLKTSDALCLADFGRRQLAMPAPAAPTQLEMTT
jgi:hypothetical protein